MAAHRLVTLLSVPRREFVSQVTFVFCPQKSDLGDRTEPKVTERRRKRRAEPAGESAAATSVPLVPLGHTLSPSPRPGPAPSPPALPGRPQVAGRPPPSARPSRPTVGKHGSRVSFRQDSKCVTCPSLSEPVQPGALGRGGAAGPGLGGAAGRRPALCPFCRAHSPQRRGRGVCAGPWERPAGPARLVLPFAVSRRPRQSPRCSFSICEPKRGVSRRPCSVTTNLSHLRCLNGKATNLKDDPFM